MYCTIPQQGSLTVNMFVINCILSHMNLETYSYHQTFVQFNPRSTHHSLFLKIFFIIITIIIIIIIIIVVNITIIIIIFIIIIITVAIITFFEVER